MVATKTNTNTNANTDTSVKPSTIAHIAETGFWAGLGAASQGELPYFGTVSPALSGTIAASTTASRVATAYELSPDSNSFKYHLGGIIAHSATNAAISLGTALMVNKFTHAIVGALGPVTFQGIGVPPAYDQAQAAVVAVPTAFTKIVGTVATGVFASVMTSDFFSYGINSVRDTVEGVLKSGLHTISGVNVQNVKESTAAATAGDNHSISGKVMHSTEVGYWLALGAGTQGAIPMIGAISNEVAGLLAVGSVVARSQELAKMAPDSNTYNYYMSEMLAHSIVNAGIAGIASVATYFTANYATKVSGHNVPTAAVAAPIMVLTMAMNLASQGAGSLREWVEGGIQHGFGTIMGVDYDALHLTDSFDGHAHS